MTLLTKLTTETDAGVPGLAGIAQVKLPVTDLAHSVDWYRSLLDLRCWVEIAEDGVVRGAGLIDRQGRFNISLRDRTVCAGRPELPGFDVVAFAPTGRAVLADLVARCERLGVAHGGIVDGPEGSKLDIPDPDGTVLRFYFFTAPTEGFTGVEFRDGRQVGTYDRPRLSRSG
jgi:catechol 2,3-dioxygenase-like lactoylglutathione lyase family enzyme